MSAESGELRPLQNRTILVACSATKMVELASGLEALGGIVLPLAVIEVQEIQNKELLDKALASLKEYSWVIFTSVHGVSFFMQRWNILGHAVALSSMPKICAVGPATARALKEYGFEAALVPEKFVAEGILEAMEQYHGGLGNLAGCRILFPRAKEARDVLPDTLAAAGVEVDVIPCYETVRAQIDKEILDRLRSANPDLAVFTSSSAIKNLIDILGWEDGMRLLRNATVAVLGPVTGRTAESFGKCPEILPGENTIASLIEAIRTYYSARG